MKEVEKAWTLKIQKVTAIKNEQLLQELMQILHDTHLMNILISLKEIPLKKHSTIN